MACCARGGPCSSQNEAAAGTLRCFENLPVIGHVIAAVYACCKDKDRAERAAIKATIGIVLSVFSFGAESIDEAARRHYGKTRSYSLKNRCDWMKAYHHLSLNNLCLPGSHQSATARMHKKLRPVPMVEGWSRCQSLSVADQLQGGVRFLDLRVMLHENDIWLHHNIVVCEKLDSVLKAVSDFVQQNPSEVVSVHLSNDGQQIDWGKVHQIINNTVGERLMFEQDRYKTIAEVVSQNKNVVIYGIPNIAYSWRCLENRWPNKNCPDDLRTDIQEEARQRTARRSPFMFWYKAECTPHATMIVRLLGGLPGLCARRCFSGKFEFVEDLAAAVNHQVLQVLNILQQLPFNVLSTDYVHDEIIDLTIKFNDKNHTGQQAMFAEPATEVTEIPSDMEAPVLPQTVYETNV